MVDLLSILTTISRSLLDFKSNLVNCGYLIDTRFVAELRSGNNVRVMYSVNVGFVGVCLQAK